MCVWECVCVHVWMYVLMYVYTFQVIVAWKDEHKINKTNLI